MKLSELIAKLQEILADHGDLYTEAQFDCCCYGDLSRDPKPEVVDNPYNTTPPKLVML